MRARTSANHGPLWLPPMYNAGHVTLAASSLPNSQESSAGRSDSKNVWASRSIAATEPGRYPAEPIDERTVTDRAVVEGIANTGRLVTSAALILFFAFIALSTVPAIEVKVLATTLALGIALDAVIVRGLLAPALVGVLGRANWTMPTWLEHTLLLPRSSSQAHPDGGTPTPPPSPAGRTELEVGPPF